MTTKLIVIIGVSVAAVVGMFVMGRLLNRDDSQPEGAVKDTAGEQN